MVLLWSAIQRGNGWSRTSALETKAQPVAPARIGMSSQLTWLARSRVPRDAGEPTHLTSAPEAQAIHFRNRRGHGERPNGLVAMCRGAQNAKIRRRPAIRPQARNREERSSVAAVESDAIELHAVVDQGKA